jgi:hypothetical protein
MKTILKITGVALVMLLCISAVIKNFMSGIHGIITPADAIKKVWAINATDTIGVAPSAGNFSIELKPGNWKIHVDAIPGYKPVTMENIIVKDGSYTDAGEIKLPAN